MLTWFPISGAGEPTLITDQQLVLDRRRIGLLEHPSVVHPDGDGDGDDERRRERIVGNGARCCECPQVSIKRSGAVAGV